MSFSTITSNQRVLLLGSHYFWGAPTSFSQAMMDYDVCSRAKCVMIADIVTSSTGFDDPAAVPLHSLQLSTHHPPQPAITCTSLAYTCLLTFMARGICCFAEYSVLCAVVADPGAGKSVHLLCL